MATVTLGVAQANQAESVEKGINAAIFKISLSVSWSSGDIHRIGKLPHGAIPLGAVFYGGSALPAGGVTAKFGTSASQELFLASLSYSNAATGFVSTRKLGPQMQISVSDDPGIAYEWVTMVATAGASVGYIGDLVVQYKMPGQTL
jgi:hypothetical protein